jgi:glycosyltransferase involved in cell wall biosynthesis
LQAEQGRDVTVILPLFQNDDETPAYDFLSTSKSIGSPKKIEVIVNSSHVEALVYEYKITLPNTHAIRLKAIKPIGEFAYLTKIKNISNPYVLSDAATLTALDMWQQENVEIKQAHEKIKESYNKLLNNDNQTKEIFDSILKKIKEKEPLEITIPLDQYYNGSLAYGEAEYATTKRLIEESTTKKNLFIEESTVKLDNLYEERKKLLTEVITGNTWALDGILFRISNIKTYYMAHLFAEVATNTILEDDIKIVHSHHFGDELQVIRKLLDHYHYKQPYPVLVKSLHGLNVVVTDLEDRPYPICIGIEAADCLHVVSRGSLEELRDDINGNRFYPESKCVNMNKVHVAANGIIYEKFSLTKQWENAKKTFPEELKSFPDTIDNLSSYQQKQHFKKALKIVLSNLETGGTKKLQSPYQNKYFNPNQTIMLFVGRMSKEKAYERLEVAAKIAKEKKAYLAIMGFGDDKFIYEIKRRYPEVLILDNIPDQQLIGSLLRGGADICLLTSNRETAGVVLLEGQAAGQTVLTTALPGPMSLSNPETFHKFDIAIKENTTERDSEFRYVDEEKTEENFAQEIGILIDYFTQSSPEKIQKDIDSNIQFAKKFTVASTLAQLDELYASGSKSSLSATLAFDPMLSKGICPVPNTAILTFINYEIANITKIPKN